MSFKKINKSRIRVFFLQILEIRNLEKKKKFFKKLAKLVEIYMKKIPKNSQLFY